MMIVCCTLRIHVLSRVKRLRNVIAIAFIHELNSLQMSSFGWRHLTYGTKDLYIDITHILLITNIVFPPYAFGLTFLELNVYIYVETFLLFLLMTSYDIRHHHRSSSLQYNLIRRGEDLSIFQSNRFHLHLLPQP